jgi:hypothetical protein
MEELRAAITKFEGVAWSNCDEPESSDDDDLPIGCVQFALDKSETGWRTLEFLSWALMEDLRRSGYDLMLTPMSAPPYLNEPGNCLSFLLQVADDPDLKKEGRDIRDIAKFIDRVRDEYWPECKPD